MGMQHSSEAELGRLFDRAGISKRLLCPLWCRALRKLGFPCRPPVTFRFVEHVCFAAVAVLAVMGTIGMAFWWLDLIPGRGLLLITLALLVLNPIVSALRYRSIRNRLKRVAAP
jgi:hypothetical protein